MLNVETSMCLEPPRTVPRVQGFHFHLAAHQQRGNSFVARPLENRLCVSTGITRQKNWYGTLANSNLACGRLHAPREGLIVAGIRIYASPG
jgi:hypothetical protein